ncbi:MAG: response regulator [Halochromatium sp.]|uniref:response regulator n=1 Tax=Halochromatium sp. TaxID=2049430 RepID=UPI00397900EF
MPWSCDPDTIRILIVDDDSMIRTFLRSTLEKLEHKRILEADSGEKAIEHFRQHQPQLVFLDIEMPGALNGLAVLDALRESEQAVSIIMITAHSTVENVRRAAARKVDGFLAKPLNPQRIKQALEHFHGNCA